MKVTLKNIAIKQICYKETFMQHKIPKHLLYQRQVYRLHFGVFQHFKLRHFFSVVLIG